jgi:hypothetical protein
LPLVVPSHRIWSARSALTCYGPDSMRQAEPSCLTYCNLVRADRKPGGVSLNLVRDLGMTTVRSAGQVWLTPKAPGRPDYRRGHPAPQSRARRRLAPAATHLVGFWPTLQLELRVTPIAGLCPHTGAQITAVKPGHLDRL